MGKVYHPYEKYLTESERSSFHFKAAQRALQGADENREYGNLVEAAIRKKKLQSSNNKLFY